MSNLGDAPQIGADGIPVARVGDAAGSEHLGASMYELRPGDEMVFQRRGRTERRAARALMWPRLFATTHRA